MKEGDRVELVSMHDDPYPIPAGTQGVIIWVNEVWRGGFTQYGIKWDNGRTLVACCPPDVLRPVVTRAVTKTDDEEEEPEPECDGYGVSRLKTLGRKLGLPEE